MWKVLFYYLLSSISVLGDSIFLFFVSLTFLSYDQNGGMLSSIVFGVDAFFQIIVGPYISKFIDAIPQLRTRVKYSFIILACLSAIMFASFFFFQKSSAYLVILFFAFIGFFSLLDTQLKSALPLYLDGKKIFPLMKSLSFSNFASRCVNIVSTSIAPLIIGIGWLIPCVLNSISYLIGLVGLFIILKLIDNSEVTKTKENITSTNEAKELGIWVKWNNYFLFLTNLAFGSVAFMLTKQLAVHKNAPFLARFINSPTPIYTGLFISFLAILVFPNFSKKLTDRSINLALLLFGVSISLLLASLSNGIFLGATLLISGFFYGITLIGSGSFIQPKLYGKKFVNAISKGQAYGRLGLLGSLFVAGYSLDVSYAPLQLLFFAGFFGILVSFLLLYLSLRVESKEKLLLEYGSK